ncbi:MAG: SCE4755 family polysaccharide monooxygenase-like protein [Polyangiales bacterium]
MHFWRAAPLLAVVALSPGQARAHLGLSSPPSRYGPDVLKTGPCGISGGERSQVISYYEPGATIEVQWEEYIDHPGHFRISFDAVGDDDFVDPATMMELYSNDAVLLDGIADQAADEPDYTATVTLPDVTCDDCTLQVIQVMYDKPPYTTPGNDIYYQCADLVLQEGGAPADGSGGCSAARGAFSGFGVTPMLVLLLAFRLARRRRFPV